MGFVPTLADPNGLTVHRRNHSAILSIKSYNQAVFLYVHFKMTNFHFLPILQFSIIKNYFTWSCQDFLLQLLSYCQSLKMSPFRARAKSLGHCFPHCHQHKLICGKLTSHPKHRTAGNSFFSYLFIFFQISKKVVAKVLQIAVFF